MMRTTVGDLVDDGALLMSDGYRTKRPEHGQPGYRIIRVADVHDGTVSLDSPDYVSVRFKDAIGIKAGSRGDTLLTTKGTVGRGAVLPPTIGSVVYSPQLCFFRLRDESRLDRRFLRYWFSSREFLRQASDRMNNTDMAAYINLADIRSLQITLRPLNQQREIAEVLGALDDKIAANAALARTAADLASTVFASAIMSGTEVHTISDVTTLLSRGITPSYSEDADAVVVMNQKCIRDQRVDVTVARRTRPEKIRQDKVLQLNDVVINSTGQGTLGRIARWTSSDAVTVDSHITIVRFDKTKIDPVCGGHAILRLQKTIEAMGEGSTGQTELSRIEVGKLAMNLPPREVQNQLGEELAALGELGSASHVENTKLAGVRDALLPGLMSGRLRVKDAETVAEAAL